MLKTGVFRKFINVYLAIIGKKCIYGIKNKLINGFEKEMILIRTLKTWNYKLKINQLSLIGLF